MSPITTHVLDTSLGKPAASVAVVLEWHAGGDSWHELARGATDADGRIRDFLADDAPLTAGIYRLRFATDDYFAVQGTRGFYPEVVVVVRIEEKGGHYHVPLLLSPFGYSTYRGS